MVVYEKPFSLTLDRKFWLNFLKTRMHSSRNQSKGSMLENRCVPCTTDNLCQTETQNWQIFVNIVNDNLSICENVWRGPNCLVTMVTDTLLYVGAGAGGFIVLVVVIAALIIVILCRRWVFVLNFIKQQLLSSKCDRVVFILRKSELRSENESESDFDFKIFLFLSIS